MFTKYMLTKSLTAKKEFQNKILKYFSEIILWCVKVFITVNQKCFYFTDLYSKMYFMYTINKLATAAEGNQKAPFSIATTPRCRKGCNSFAWIALLTLDPFLIMLSVKQGGLV